MNRKVIETRRDTVNAKAAANPALPLLRLLLAGLLLLAAARAFASEWPAPSPTLSADEVVALQLEALKHNNQPSPNAGIERTWAFAHPDNRAYTGPLPRFIEMLHMPGYAELLEHRDHRITALARTEVAVEYRVQIVAANGVVSDYYWRVQRVLEGELEGCWMTSSVSQAKPVGRSA